MWIQNRNRTINSDSKSATYESKSDSDSNLHDSDSKSDSTTPGVYAGWKCCLSWYWQTIIRARGRLFPNAPTRARDCFAMPQLERATRFPNVPSRVATRFRMFQFEHEWSPVRSLCIRLVFFYNKYYFLSQYAFHVYVLIVLIKAWFSQHVAFIR